MNQEVPSEWHILSRYLSRESDILGRHDAKTLWQLYKDGFALVVEEYTRGVSIVAFAALWPSSDGWKELGSLWVHPLSRGQGFASRVFQGLVQLRQEETGIFLITKNSKVRHLALGNGWNRATEEDWEEPVPWAASCGPCDRWETREEKFRCSYKARMGECELYYLPPSVSLWT